MRYLLDTCVISEATRKKPAAQVIRWLRKQDEPALFLSAITLGELHRGVQRLPDGRKRRRLADWIEHDLSRRFSGRILAVDPDVALRWGDLCATLEKLGRPIPVLDGLLAATALTFGLTLVTRNSEHMKASGATLIDPWLDGTPDGP